VSKENLFLSVCILQVAGRGLLLAVAVSAVSGEFIVTPDQLEFKIRLHTNDCTSVCMLLRRNGEKD
jgi:hypothetical protein